MKLFLCSLLFSFCITNINAQITTDADLVGKWKVIKIKDLVKKRTEAETKKIAEAIKAFEQATFTFGADKKFTFQIPIEALQIKSAFWSLDTAKGIINIAASVKSKNKADIMQIDYKSGSGITMFLMPDTGLALKMEKF